MRRSTFMVPAVLLAAGNSHRMGVPKALLKMPGGSSFLKTITANLHRGGFGPILLILGREAARIRPYVPEEVDRILVNEHPELGQLASFQLGIRHLPPGVPGCLMALIDHPLISASTFQRIAEHLQQAPDRIAIPSKNFKKGHPTYFPARFFDEILSAPLEAGARQILKNHPEAIDYILVDDDGIFIDFDTPEMYTSYFKTGRVETISEFSSLADVSNFSE